MYAKVIDYIKKKSEKITEAYVHPTFIILDIEGVSKLINFYNIKGKYTNIGIEAIDYIIDKLLPFTEGQDANYIIYLKDENTVHSYLINLDGGETGVFK